MSEDWPCEAYGPEAMEFGAVCFVASELHKRVCLAPLVCRVVMTDARRTLHARITERAAGGDPVSQDLLEAFPTPDLLLGGGGHE